MTKDAHPLSYERLVAYAFDELTAEEAAVAAAHVAVCNSCSASLRRLWHIHGALRVTPVLAPPPVSLARAKRIFRPLSQTLAGRLLRRWRLTSPRVALSGVALVILVSAATAQQVAAAAQMALPGDQLYPIKRIVADIQLAATFDPVDRAQLHLTIIKEQAQEISILFERGRFEDIPTSVESYRTEIDAAAVALRLAAQNNRPDGLRLVQHTVESLAASAEQFAELGAAGSSNAEPLLQSAAQVAEAGRGLIEAQLTLQALTELEALSHASETPTATLPAMATPTASGTTERPPATRTVVPTTPVTQPSITPTASLSPSSTPVPTATTTPSAAASATLQSTPTPSATPTTAPTETPAATGTPVSPEPSATPEATNTPAPSETATRTETATSIPSATYTPTGSPTIPPSDTPDAPPSMTPTEASTVPADPTAEVTPVAEAQGRSIEAWP